jgi:TIR domain
VARVFISFVHEDGPIANAVKKLLELDLGLDGEVFIVSDPRQLRPGDDWFAKIHDALKSAEVVLQMLSARSVKRPWVNFEAGAAWLAGKTVIPVCYGNMKKDRLPRPYSDLQAVSLAHDQDALMRTLADRLQATYTSPFLRSLGKSIASQPADIFELLASARPNQRASSTTSGTSQSSRVSVGVPPSRVGVTVYGGRWRLLLRFQSCWTT